MSGLYSRARHAWRNDGRGRGRRAGSHRWFTTPAGGGAPCAPRACRRRQTGLPGTSDAACRSSWRGDGSGPCRGHGDGSGRSERRRRHLRGAAAGAEVGHGRGPAPPVASARMSAAACWQGSDEAGRGSARRVGRFSDSETRTQTETEAGSCGRMTTPMKRTERGGLEWSLPGPR
jgi:hypothetical protein